MPGYLGFSLIMASLLIVTKLNCQLASTKGKQSLAPKYIKSKHWTSLCKTCRRLLSMKKEL